MSETTATIPKQMGIFRPRLSITFDDRESDPELRRALSSVLRWRPGIEEFEQVKDGYSVLRQLAGVTGSGPGPQEVHLDHLPYAVEWAEATADYFLDLIQHAALDDAAGKFIPDWLQAVKELRVAAHLVQEIIDWFGVEPQTVQSIPFGPDDFEVS